MSCHEQAYNNEALDLTFEQITLQDMEGMDRSAKDVLSAENSVVYFLSPECPLCQNYSVEIKKIAYDNSANPPLTSFYGAFFANASILTSFETAPATTKLR